MPHATVLPPPPVVTSASPFLRLPGGTYATNPDFESRSSVRGRSSGTSMIREPTGSVAAGSTGANMPAAILVFGTAGFDHLYPWLQRDRMEIHRCGPVFFLGRRLGNRDHR